MDAPTTPARYNLLEPVLLFLFCLALLLPSIWQETSITGQDEYWLSLRTPLEMQARHDWLTPWLNGSVRLTKPPLLYWCILISQHFSGVSLAAARIWGTLAGSGLALCSYLLAKELFNRHALLAGLITASSIGVVLQGRQAMLDLPVAFFSCLATYFAWLALNRKKLIPALLSSACLGLGCMVKGPICIYFFSVSLTTGAAFLGRRIFAGFPPRYFLAAAISFLAVCLPWPLAMYHLHPGFLSIIAGELGAREIGSINLASPFSALGGALGLVYPWTIVVIGAVTLTFCDASARDRRTRWLACWYLASIVPFFFMKSFERYMLAIIPPLAILCAYHLDNGMGRAKKWLLWSAAALTAVVALFFCLMALWFKLAVLSPVLGLVALAFSILAAKQQQNCPAAAAIATTLMVIFGLVYPRLGINALPEDITAMAGNQRVAVFNSPQPSMLSMRLKKSVTALDPEQTSGPNNLAGFSGLVFVTREETMLFQLLAEKQQKTVKEAGMFRTFYSRKAWQRIAREDATARDWREAFANRSLENLKSQIFIYKIF